jgi:hypothetical protein
MEEYVSYTMALILYLESRKMPKKAKRLFGNDALSLKLSRFVILSCSPITASLSIMSHHIEGFIFKQQETAERFTEFANAITVSLRQGFIFVPLTDELSDEIGSDDNLPYEAFWKLRCI